jgi:hypothetical protein
VSANLFFPHLPEDTRLWQDDCPACLVETGKSVQSSVLNNGCRVCDTCLRLCAPQPIRYSFKEWSDRFRLGPALMKAAALILSEPLGSRTWPHAVVESNFEGLRINHGEFKTYLARTSGLDKERTPTPTAETIAKSRSIPEALKRVLPRLDYFKQFSSPIIGNRICLVGEHEMEGVEIWISLVDPTRS